MVPDLSKWRSVLLEQSMCTRTLHGVTKGEALEKYHELSRTIMYSVFKTELKLCKNYALFLPPHQSLVKKRMRSLLI